MSPVYLKEVSITDFRCIGQLSVELPAPGALILSGPNGLGKSTFLEAIEWAFDGVVSRVSLHVERKSQFQYLSRICSEEQNVNKFGVQLRFQGSADSAPIHLLSREFIQSSTPEGYIESKKGFDHLNDWLVNDKWSISNDKIATYLRLTHLLPQPREQQYVWQNSNERWENVQEPAGLKRLTLVQERLRRAYDSRGPMGRLLETCKHSLNALNSELSEWKNLLINRDKHIDQAHSEGAMSPNDIIARAQVIASEIDVIIEQSSSIDLATATDARHLLSRLRDASTFQRQRLGGRRDKLRILERNLHQVHERRAGIPPLEEELGRLAVEADQLARAIASSVEDIEQKEANHKRLNSELQQIFLRLEHLEKLAQSWTSLPNLRAQLRGIEATQIQLQSELSNALSERKNIDAAIEEKRLLTSSLSSLNNRIQLFEDVQHRMEAWTQSAASLPRLREERVSLTALEQSLERDVADAESEVARLQVQLDQSMASLQEWTEQANAKQRAIAQLLATIREADRECPICRTTFSKVGELLERASQSRTVEDEELLKRERNVGLTRETLFAAEEHLQELRNNLEQTQQSIRRNQKQLTEQEQEDSKVRSLPLITELLSNDSTNRLSPIEIAGRNRDNLQRLAAQRADLEHKLAQYSGANDPQELQVQFQETIKILQERVAEEERKFFVAQRTVQDHEAVLNTDQEVSPAWSAGLRNPSEDVSTTRANQLAKLNLLREIESFIDSARQAYDQLIINRTKLETRRANNHREINEISAEWEEVVSLWKSAQLGADMPDLPVLRKELLFVDEQFANVDLGGRVDKLLDDLARALDRWEAMQTLEQIQHEISRRLEQEEFHSEQELTAHLERGVSGLTMQREWQNSRVELAKKLGSLIKQESAEYAATVLEPLNERVERCLAVLSSDRPWRIREELTRTAGRSKLCTSAYWGIDGERSEVPCDVRSLLSEGQLAAVSLAQVIAMSTSWTWSRWPALLLDDPAQYNDIVHVAAFIDLVRNLILDRGYQVVISTHDAELATFFHRKLAAVSIPCRIVRFLAHSPSGVEIDTVG